MNRQTKYPPELREQAIRMIYEQREHHESEWAAIESVAKKIGGASQTLRNRIAKAEVKAGGDCSPPRQVDSPIADKSAGLGCCQF